LSSVLLVEGLAGWSYTPTRPATFRTITAGMPKQLTKMNRKKTETFCAASQVGLSMENALTLNPIKSLDGTITLPGSKSLSNRVLLLAALSHGGPTRVENLLDSDDIRYMIKALRQMNVNVDQDPCDVTCVTVSGQAGPINAPSDEVCELFLGNAGTAMRPLTAVLCMGKGDFVLDGVPRMRERPISDLVDGLKQLGADVACVAETGCPPVTIQAKGLRGGQVRNRLDYFSIILTRLVNLKIARIFRLRFLARCHPNFSHPS